MDEASMEKLSDMAERVSSELSERLPTAEETREKLGQLADALGRAFGGEGKDGEDGPLLERVETFVDGFPFLQTLEERTGVPKLVLFYGVASLGVIILLGSITNMLLGLFTTRCLGFLYPAYASFKAIESPMKEDDTQWVTYWVVFACFTLLEQTLLKPFALLFPLYFAFKIGFLLWCQNRGAEMVYVLILRPAFASASVVVDQALQSQSTKKRRGSSKVSLHARDDPSYNPYESDSD